jgi:predicted nucleic acid-binding protein
VTTDEVLTEFLAALSGYGDGIRRQAARMARVILDDPNVHVVPQSRDSFLRGLVFYEQRPDKGYSLTDCISMNAMRTDGLTEVLTNDHHFEQEGFTVLVRP